MNEKRYKKWTPMVMFSDKGDEIKHVDDYFVCVYPEPMLDNRWTYMVQLPDTKVVYPGTKDKPLSFDSKNAAKQSVDSWDDNTLSTLRDMFLDRPAD